MNILTTENVNLVVNGLIIPAVMYGVGQLGKYIKSKIKNQNYSKYVDIAEKAVETAVASVGQTVVDVHKKNDTFDQAAKEEAFARAKEISLSIMGQAAKDVVTEAHGDFNAWIDNQIEKHVKLLK